MAIASTSSFNPDIGEIIEEAYERIGVTMRSGYQLRSAKRSLNLLMLDWSTYGINYWKFEDVVWDSNGDGTGTTTLTSGVHTYNLKPGTISVRECIIRTNDGQGSQTDYAINRVSQQAYAGYVNKNTTGRPNQYMIDRKEINDVSASAPTDRLSTITLWPVPDASNKYTLVYWRMARMADVSGDANQTVEVPDRVIPALVAGLTYQLAIKSDDPVVSQKIGIYKSIYDECWQRAFEEDRDRAGSRITPRVASI